MKPLVLLLLVLFSSSCARFFYFPDHNVYFPPDKLGLKHESFLFDSKDGTKLAGWFFPAKTKNVKGTIIQFHGNAENMTSHYTSRVWVVEQGYNLFTFDYRGYGSSENRTPDQAGTYFDASAALDEAWKRRESHGGGRFIIYGQSLGGAVAMRASHDFAHLNETDLIVMDSTFVSYRTVARRVAASHWLTWLFQPFAWLFTSNKYSAVDALKENQRPLLVIHDKHDPGVPFANGEDIFEMSRSPVKEFWTTDVGHHIAVFWIDKGAYREKFLKFLEGLPKP